MYKAMRWGLRDEIIEMLKGVFTSFEDINQVVIYGSRAKGNFKPGSDIDLCIKSNVSSAMLDMVKIKIDELPMLYKVDISVYSHLTNEDLKEHIDRVGQVFYL